MIIDRDYVPTEKTFIYLEKKHFTRKHIWAIVDKFRINFDGREFENIEEKFKTVMKLEPESNRPQKNIKPYEIDLSHKSDKSEQKAAALKDGAPMFTNEQAIVEYENRKGNTNDRPYKQTSQGSQREHHSKGGGE